MKFIDEVTIEVASGNGGPGCVSFRREKFAPRGGPDGGNGGRGGYLIFKTSSRIHSLLDLKIKKTYHAKNGSAGMSSNRSGADGKDMVISVPVGTVLKTPELETLRDLDSEGEFVFIEGGKGGKGNSFYKTSTNQAPGLAQKGMPGANLHLKLELKLLADVGIIGFPNAGKSTLISHLSAAKPKVADYPFTTLVPNLGVIRYGDDRSFVVADMPGLLKDAHKGVGLGTRFLRHLERTKCFVHLVDASECNGRDPIRDYQEINFELNYYDDLNRNLNDYIPLSSRPQLLVLNKIDVLSSQQIADLRARFLNAGHKPFFVSAATGQNLKELVRAMGEQVFSGSKDEL